ncbi:MAG: hypothetical protein L6Q49_12130 [Anaerolineales bacterium]|nr:hypothetical protein [Anaerolineales bacterium]
MTDHSHFHSSQSSNSHAAALVLTACAVGILMTFLVYSGNFTFGSYIGIWVYRYFEETYSLPRWIPALSLALLAISVFIGGRYIHIREKMTLALGLVNSITFQIPAAVFIAKIEKSALLFFLVAGTLVIQTLLALHRIGFVVPYSLN